MGCLTLGNVQYQKRNILKTYLKQKNVDRVIEKKFWSKKKILTILGIVALAGLIGASIYFTSGPTKLAVDLDRLEVREVIKGAFTETIPENGVVLPKTTIYLDAQEGGRVEERYV